MIASSILHLHFVHIYTNVWFEVTLLMLIYNLQSWLYRGFHFIETHARHLGNSNEESTPRGPLHPISVVHSLHHHAWKHHVTSLITLEYLTTQKHLLVVVNSKVWSLLHFSKYEPSRAKNQRRKHWNLTLTYMQLNFERLLRPKLIGGILGVSRKRTRSSTR